VSFYYFNNKSVIGLKQTLIEPEQRCFSTSPKYGCKTEWTWTFEPYVRRPVIATNEVELYTASHRPIYFEWLEITLESGQVLHYTVEQKATENSSVTVDLGSMFNITSIKVRGYVPQKKHPRSYGGIRFYDYYETFGRECVEGEKNITKCDGTEIITAICVGGKWVKTGATCPNATVEAYQNVTTIVQCIEGQEITITCPDGTVIPIYTCINGTWVQTGQVCPVTEEEAFPIEIFFFGAIGVVVILIIYLLVKKPRR